MIEHERRFLVAALPEPLPSGTPIEQAYLMTDPAAVRVRRQGDRYSLTIKTPLAGGSGLSRTEIERDLDAEEFAALWAVATELRITKVRHRVPLDGGHVAELDQFSGDLAGHRLVEVEFASEHEAHRFAPPPWFGREVTDDGSYTNAVLARTGWPPEPEREPPIDG